VYASRGLLPDVRTYTNSKETVRKLNATTLSRQKKRLGRKSPEKKIRVAIRRRKGETSAAAEFVIGYLNYL